MGTVQELRELTELLVRTGARPIIDREMPMEQAAQALEAMDAGDIHGKIVLTRG